MEFVASSSSLRASCSLCMFHVEILSNTWKERASTGHGMQEHRWENWPPIVVGMLELDILISSLFISLLVWLSQYQHIYLCCTRSTAKLVLRSKIDLQLGS